MIIYNVTLNVDNEVHESFLHWLRTEHIPEVLSTGLFVEHKFLKLLSEEEGAMGTTYAVQYTLKELQHFLEYSENHAPLFQKKTQEKFGEKVLAFRTLLEVME